MVTTNPSSRTRDVAPLGGAHEPADVMHLEPEQVSDAVRQEHARDRGGKRLVGAAAGDVRLAQQFPGELVRLEMYVAPVDAGAHPGAQRLLHLIHAADE